MAVTILGQAMTHEHKMTMEELLDLPVSFGIPVAARALGLGRSKAYDLIARDEFPVPVRRYGREYRVTRPDLFRHFGLEPDRVAAEVTPRKPNQDAA
jgi:predicted DNA-binding transcriptional regulator AlpA